MRFTRTLFFFFFLFSFVVSIQIFFEEVLIQEDGEERIVNLTEPEAFNSISKTIDFPGFQGLSEQINQTYFANIQSHITNFSTFDQSRFTGYPGYESAAAYIRDFFMSQGLENASFLTYPLLVPLDKGTMIEVNGENYTAHTLMPNSLNPGKTASDGVTGNLIYGGKGTYSELDGKKIEDAIVVLEFNSLDNWINVASLGASGVIFLPTDETNRFEAEEKVLDIPLHFPRLYIENQTTATAIKNLSMQGDQQITFFSDMEWTSIAAKNVMGLLPGISEDIIIISAYFDSASIVPAIAPGADEACSIASMLEFIRIIKDNSIVPEKTIMFLALSGHNQQAAGARNFVDQYYSSLNVNKGIKLFLSFDLSSTNNKIAINPYGYLYKFQLQYTTGNRLITKLKDIAQDFFLSYTDAIMSESDYSFNVKSYVTNQQFKDIAPITFVGDHEPFIASNVLGLSLFTSESHRLNFNTPTDLYTHISTQEFDFLKNQVVYSLCALAQLIVDVDLNPVLSNLENKQFQLKVATNAHVGYGYIEGFVKQYDETNAWLINVPNALVRVRAYSNRDSSFGEYSFITRADETGYYQIQGVSSSQPDYPLEFIVDAYLFDSEGNLIKAIDLGTRGQYFKNSNSLTKRRTTVNPTVFDCGTFSIFGIYHPFTQVSAAQNLDYTVIDPQTRNLFFSYGYTGLKTVSLVFVQPDVPSIAVGKYNDGILGVYATNSDNQTLRGKGFTLGHGEFENLGYSSFITARDLLSTTQTYITLYSLYNIYDALVESTYHTASELLNTATALKNDYQYSQSIATIIESHTWAYDSFRQARKVIQDGTTTSIFFAILLIPFAFALSALLFDFDSGIKRILATSTIYAAVFGFFYLIHPGMHLSRNIAMIIIGVVATIFVFPALFMIYQEGYDFLKSLRLKQLGSHFADTSRTSTLLIAMSTGISRMKKRKGRTVIALSGIVLITFSLTLFTSATTQITTYSKGENQDIAYEGLYIRTKDWEFSLPEVIIENLRVTYGDQIQIASRWWLYPPSDTSEFPNGYVKVETPDGNEKWEGAAILGMTAEEQNFHSLETILVAGRWFTSSNSSECVLVDVISNKLDVAVNETVIWAGQEFIVVGIISSQGLDRIKDYDTEKITPKNNHAPAPNVHIQADETFILPAYTVKSFGGTISSISITAKNKTLEELSLYEEIAGKISSTYGRNLLVRVGINDEVTIYKRQLQSLGEGLGDLGIPLLIAVLLMINTSVSTVYESRKEINTFTSLGLAPVHIAGLFLAEFLVYAVIGSVIGYLMGITSAVILSALGIFPESLAINYSSGSIVSALGLGIGGILLSTIYPLRISAKMSVPSVRRTWELKTTYKEDGKTWTIPLPFVAATEQEAEGIIEFLREYFVIYESESVGGAFFAQNISTSEADIERREKHLTAIVNLAPFDAGLKQEVDIYTYLEEIKFHYIFEINLVRLEGILLAWESSVRRFVDSIRKQLLIWRSLPKEEKALKSEKFRTNLKK
ncbi:MAG: M28 family peptidase [Candidatus Hodarchaeales archaeon]